MKKQKINIFLLAITMVYTVSISHAGNPFGSGNRDPFDHPLYSFIDKELENKGKAQLELFVMSQCPYAIEAEQSLIPILKEFGGKIDFKLRFVASIDQRNQVSSLHGQQEVEENRRQAVIAHLYPQQFLDYLLARSRNYDSEDWKIAASAAHIPVDEVECLAASAEGERLLLNAIRPALERNVHRSPTIFMDGQRYDGGILPAQPKKAESAASGKAGSSLLDEILYLLTGAKKGTFSPSSMDAPCGNGIRESDEGCDDGNMINGDGCSATCSIEPGYACSNGTPNVCVPGCGDGIVYGFEGCDDGNNVNGDGCSAACQVEICMGGQVLNISAPNPSQNGTTGSWTVPSGGPYKVRITAKGAKGGSSNFNVGGKGAEMIGEFLVASNQLIEGNAGAPGQNYSHYGGGGGGSGVKIENHILIVAAGGGGASNGGGAGLGGTTSINGLNGVDIDAGYAGTNGAGGGGGGIEGGSISTGGGGGYLSAGENGAGNIATGGGNGFNANGGNSGGGGGFGGGGGTYYSGGGGGGYSGGGGSGYVGGGGGGGSYNAGTNQNNTSGANNAGGQVIIECLGAATFTATVTPTQPVCTNPTQGSLSIDLTGDNEGNTAGLEYAIVAGSSFSGSPIFSTITADPFNITSGFGTTGTATYTVRIRLKYNPTLFIDQTYTITAVPDGDGDGIGDVCDNCPTVPNFNQIDTDGDTFGEACDCKDNDNTTYPGAPETCNGIDNNCDGMAVNSAVNPIANQFFCVGAASVAFSGGTSGTVYNWTNNNTAIGLPASGSGSLNFTATNGTSAPISGTITVTPVNGTCTGTPISFTIIVDPTPDVTQPANQVICNGSPTATVSFSGSTSGTVYNWTNDNASIGLAANGTGDIASFTATNATNAPVAANVTVTPSIGGTGTATFNYTGAMQTFTVPPGVTSITINAEGAQGGGNAGGLGGSATATLPVTPGEVLEVWVGGRPTQEIGPGGFNGGGAVVVEPCGSGPTYSHPGGGASDVRRGAGLANRIIVAGGGGGQGWSTGSGGSGGGTTGVDGTASWIAGTNGKGGSQSAGGAGGFYGGNGQSSPSGVLGVGGDGSPLNTYCTGGGGGGGYYGGGGGYVSAGGGGSSYIGCAGSTNASTTPGTRSGDGLVTIAYSATMCVGSPKTFTITVNPTPNAVATPAAQTICPASAITTIAMSGNVPGTVYNWTRDNTATVTGDPDAVRRSRSSTTTRRSRRDPGLRFSVVSG